MHNTKRRGFALRRGRYSAPGQIYMVITVTWQRQKLFASLMLGRCVVRAIYGVEQAHTLAYVVMPDHLHWLIELNQGSLSEVVQRAKTASARELNLRLGREPARVWQKGFHDHALRQEEDLQNIARYIVANPLRAGLVEDVRQYSLWDAVYL